MKPTLFPTALHGLCVAAALLASAAARAADTDAARQKGNVLSFGPSKASAAVLTRAQLRECLAQEPLLKTEREALLRDQAELDAAKAEITRRDGELTALAAALQAERETTDASKQEAVDAFNLKLRAHNDKAQERQRLVDAFDARLPAINARAGAHNAAQQTWQSGCAGRSYNEADYFAIQRGK